MARRRPPGFSPETVRLLELRSTQIAAYTQRKGMPSTYGDGKAKEIPPAPAREKAGEG